MLDFDNQGVRLEEIRKQIKLDKRSFVKKIGYNNETSYNSIVRGDRAISSKVLTKLLENYPQFNLNWLIGGYGSMIITELLDSKNEINTDYSINQAGINNQVKEVSYAGSSELEILKKEIEICKEKVEYLTKHNETLQELVQVYKSKIS